MNDNIDKNEIRRAIDKLQTEHPCHFAFDATKFDSADSIDVVKRVIDNVMESIRDDADIHIICEMAKLYLDGVKPTVERPVERPHGEWETAYLDHVSFGARPKVIYCSNCNSVVSHKSNFCEECGADMREEEVVENDAPR